MYNVVITGASCGIGLATAIKFIEQGHKVYGIDVQPCYDEGLKHNSNYTHIIGDVRNPWFDIDDVNILINNAGVQNSDDDIGVNLEGVINCTEKYGLQPSIHSIVNLASVSGHNGAEFGRYTASKGGVLSYTVWTAKQIAKYGATCNSISAGGVITELNAPVLSDQAKWAAIMNETPLKKWATAREIAYWIYFLTTVNTSMSGQDLIIDNLETYNHNFIW